MEGSVGGILLGGGGVHPPCADFAMVFVMFCSPIPKQGDLFEDIGRILKSKWKFWMDFFLWIVDEGSH